MTRTHRAPRIDLPIEWLERVAKERDRRGWSLDELGRHAAEAIGRTTPFSNPTMSRFLRGVTTQDVAEGVALALGVPLPVARLSNPAHQEWCDLGRRLDSVAPAMFLSELHELRDIVLALERRQAERARNL